MQVVRLLLDHGAEPETRDSNPWSALHVAALRDNGAMCGELIESVGRHLSPKGPEPAE